MKAKDLFFDFINHVFLLSLVGFVIFFFIVGDRFGKFVEVMRSLMPVAIFGIIFLVMLKIKRMKFKQRQKSGNEYEEIVLYLSYFDELKCDILVFLLPIAILIIPFIKYGDIAATDIAQASVAFSLMYLWRKILFKKRG